MNQDSSIPTLTNHLFTTFGRSTTSEIFELVAEDNTRFFIHKDILTSQSQPFQDATRGEWKEARERKINLKDWDSDTIARLVQFLYTGDYQYPDPVLIPPVPESAEVIGETAKPREKAPEPTLDGSRRPFTPLDKCLEGLVSRATNDRLSDFERLLSFNGAKSDYGDALLSHAKVYALACYKCIGGLKTLALERLLRALLVMKSIEPGSHLLPNIVDLARYTYAHTVCRVNSTEPLRKLVSQFIVLNFTPWQTEPAAEQLMCEGGDLVKDVMAGVSRRLVDLAVPQVILERRFISGLKVVRSQTAPSDCVKDLHGKDPQLRYRNSPPAWLVPKYTTRKDDACTTFVTPRTRPGSFDAEISAHNFGATITIAGIKEAWVMEKVTEVALVRFDTNMLDLDSVAGYTGMSPDIGIDGTFLYLVWKTVKVT